MSDGFKLLDINIAVSAAEHAAYGEDPSFKDCLRRQAARKLAVEIIEKAAIYKRIDPEKDAPWPIFQHRWQIGIQTDLDEVAARNQQMEEARLMGRTEAADILVRAAEVYDHLRGSCAHVLAYELREMATKIRQVEPKPTSEPTLADFLESAFKTGKMLGSA